VVKDMRPTKKDEQSTAKEVQIFLKKGGVIKQLKHGETADTVILRQKFTINIKKNGQ
jgi:hypothetical protein